MNRLFIYRKKDVHYQFIKFTTKRPGLSDVDSLEECEGKCIYMVQINNKEVDEQKKAKTIADIT